MSTWRITRGMFRSKGRIGHPSSWRYYYVANSLMGLLWIFQVQLKPRADRDLRRTKDGVLVVTHGWPEKLTPRPVEEMLFTDVVKYKRNGLVTTSLRRQFEYVASRKWPRRNPDPGFVVEPKGLWTIRNAADAQEIKRWSVLFGVPCEAYVRKEVDKLRSNKTRQSALLRNAGIKCTVI